MPLREKKHDQHKLGDIFDWAKFHYKNERNRHEYQSLLFYILNMFELLRISLFFTLPDKAHKIFFLNKNGHIISGPL